MIEREPRDAQASEREPTDDGHCFACGPLNEHGLRLQFTFAAENARAVHAETVLAPSFQGWVGFAHGGVICMLLDEAMAHAAARAEHCGVTAGMKVRFRRPTPLGEKLIVWGELVEQRGKILRLTSEVRNLAGRVLAAAEGDFMSRGPLDPKTLFSQRAQFKDVV